MLKLRRPKRLQARAWDPLTAKYASLDNPEWLQGKVPKYFWDDPENHKRYITWLAKQLKIQSMEDWYSVDTRDFVKRRGGRFLMYYDSSFFAVLRHHFPAYDWLMWKFKYVRRNFWTAKENRIRYLLWLEKQLGYKTPDDWHNTSHLDFRRNHGKVIIEKYGENVFTVLKELYPKKVWLPWKFKVVSRGFWTVRENRAMDMNWLGKKLGYKKMQDWYQISKATFSQNYGRALIDRFNASPAEVVKDSFRRYDWIPWLFDVVPDNFWSVKSNRTQYLNWLGGRLGFKRPEDWYRLREPDFIKNKGVCLFRNHYHGSPRRAVAELFPNRVWHAWLFVQIPKNYWSKKSHRLEYLNWIKTKFLHQVSPGCPELTTAIINKNRGSSLTKLYSIRQLRSEATKAFSADI